MGCDFTPEVLPVSPFTKCKTSITNLRSKLIVIFPLKRPKILACTIRHFIILNMEDRTDELACSFSSEITCALLISNPNVKLLAGKATGEIEILAFAKENRKIFTRSLKQSYISFNAKKRTALFWFRRWRCFYMGLENKNGRI